MPQKVLKVTGLAEVQKKIFSFSKKLGDKVIIDSLKQGARVVQKTAKAKAPIGKRGPFPGRLKKAIVVRNSKINSKRRAKYTGKMGVYLTVRRTKNKDDPKNAYYGRFVEDGYNVRGKKSGSGGKRKTGRGKRDMAGQKFMRSAYRSQRGNAARVIIRSVEKGADIVAKRTGLQ